MILQQYNDPRFQRNGFFNFAAIRSYAEGIIDKYDVRSGKGPLTYARSMSGGNQQKAILGREIERQTDIIIAVQPTRGLDVGAIEFIHNTLIALRDQGKAVLLISLELDEVMTLSDRILVMYEGELVGAFDPQKTDEYELGLYMSGSKKAEVQP
jgi:simple sugar transport system ATP-binding protein